MPEHQRPRAEDDAAAWRRPAAAGPAPPPGAATPRRAARQPGLRRARSRRPRPVGRRVVSRELAPAARRRPDREQQQREHANAGRGATARGTRTGGHRGARKRQQPDRVYSSVAPSSWPIGRHSAGSTRTSGSSLTRSGMGCRRSTRRPPSALASGDERALGERHRRGQRQAEQRRYHQRRPDLHRVAVVRAGQQSAPRGRPGAGGQLVDDRANEAGCDRDAQRRKEEGQRRRQAQLPERLARRGGVGASARARRHRASAGP